MRYAVEIKETRDAELDPRLRVRTVGLQLFDTEEDARRYAATCTETTDVGRTWGIVREATRKDKEFA